MKSGLLFLFLFLFLFLTCLLNGQTTDNDAAGEMIDSLVERAMSQISDRLLDEAMQTLGNAKNLAIESFGEEHPKYADCVYQEGRIYYFQNQSEEAEKAFLKAISIRQKKLGDDHPELAAVLRNLGILYSRMGQYPKADSVYQIAKGIHEKQKDVDPLAYANILNNLAILYVRTGRFSEAEQYYFEVLELRGTELGKDDPLYIGTLNNIGSMYYRWGQFEEAEEEYLKVKKWRAENLGKDHIQYARILSNMANLYTDMGRYEEAERFYTEILKWQEQNLGKESEDYGFTLGYLGLLCIDLGRYEEAGRYLRESVKVIGDIFGKDHFEYAYNLDYLAGFYHTMGLLEEAEKHYQESKNIREKVLGKQHEDYGRALNNLAILYAEMNQDDQAETLYKEAKDVFSESGEGSTDYIWTLNNLAILYKNQGRYEPAKNYLQEASSLWEKTLGKSHPNYANSLEDLALVLQQTGELKSAIGLQEEAQRIFAKALGENHLRYAQSSSYLAGMYNATGRAQEALPLLLKANEIHNQQLTEATRHLSQRDLPKYIRLFESYLQKFYAFTSEHHDEMPQLTDACFENALFHKGFVLMAANQIGRLAKSDPIASQQFEQLQSYHRRIAWEMAKPVEERLSLSKLKNMANELERKLVGEVKNIGEAVHQVTVAELEQTLGERDIIIEFIDYRVEGKSDSVQYAALVLKKDGFGSENKCLFVPLCMEASLQSLLKISTNRQADYVNTLYGVSRRGASPIGEKQPSLYELIWEPLEKVLNEIGLAEGEKLNIYFSPSGLLNRLNIAAIPIDRRTQLADRYNLVRLGSSRSLFQKRENGSKVENAILYGGLEYEFDEQRLAQLIDEEKAPLMAMRNLASALPENDTITRAYRGGTWSYLEWSVDEVEDINIVLKEKGISSKTIKEWDGTENRFKLTGAKGPSPHVIHLATHGFFFPDPAPKSGQRLSVDAEGGTVFKLSEDPMMRSGLIMSGGGYFWNQPKKRSPDGEDGILTAYEVSQMDLSNTELVVLSACETGLGDIVGDEGVYGLQRAFKIAGAKHLIISLWEVPDRETKDFMITFYGHWVGEGLPIKEAFQKTQRKIKDRFYDPFTWAGFILVE